MSPSHHGPVALARAQCAQIARVLLEATNLPIVEVALVAGFAGVRQLEDGVGAVLATTPAGLRVKRGPPVLAPPGTLALRLPYRVPMDLEATLGYLGRRAIANVEQHQPGSFTRAIRVPSGPALITVSAAEGAVACRVRVTDPRNLVAVVSRVRRLLDLDADPSACDGRLGAGPALGPLVAERPGLRSAGAVGGFEMAVRAVVGQQISVGGARTLLGRIAAEHGSRAFAGHDFRLFPRAAELAGIDPASLPLPRARARTLLALAAACASGELTLAPGADRERDRATLLALRGIGPWTADYVQMRAMSDPDVLLATDLGVRRSADRLGLDLADGRPNWAPWRSYATHHLWAAPH